jgi:hypothetical protein
MIKHVKANRLLYALSSMLYAICSMPYALCHMLDAICSMPYALCHMLYAMLYAMLYTVCSILYALYCMLYAICHMLYFKNRRVGYCMHLRERGLRVLSGRSSVGTPRSHTPPQTPPRSFCCDRRAAQNMVESIRR